MTAFEGGVLIWILLLFYIVIGPAKGYDAILQARETEGSFIRPALKAGVIKYDFDLDSTGCLDEIGILFWCNWSGNNRIENNIRVRRDWRTAVVLFFSIAQNKRLVTDLHILREANILSRSFPVVYDVPIPQYLSLIVVERVQSKLWRIQHASYPNVWSFIILKIRSSVCNTLIGSGSGLLQFRKLLLEFYQRSIRNYVLPYDSQTSASGYENANATQDNHPNLKTRKWLTFPLFLVRSGIVGDFGGLYLIFLYKHERRFLWGLASVICGIGLFLWGLNLVFAHMFVTVKESSASCTAWTPRIAPVCRSRKSFRETPYVRGSLRCSIYMAMTKPISPMRGHTPRITRRSPSVM